MRIKLNDTQDLDEFSIQLQKLIAFLQDNGVHSLERCNLYLSALKPSGSEKIFEAGRYEDFEIIPDKPGKGGVKRSPKKEYKPDRGR